MELTPHEYYCMTRAEFILKSKGYKTGQDREWERARFIGYQTYKFAPKKGKAVSITKFLPLDTDNANIIELSEEEKRAKWQRLKNNESKTDRTS
jgi:hypothetical protein